LRLTYDPQADAAFIYIVEEIAPGEASRSFMCDLEVSEGAVILVTDADQGLLGIEVLGASRLLPASVIASAVNPDGT
jgi:uncharacterized protein YuzE